MKQTFLFLENTKEPNKKRVTGYMYMPEMLSEEELKQGVLVEYVPIHENIQGKRSELFYNTDTQELFYEYYDMEPMPPTPEQIMQNLQNELKTVKEETKKLKLAIAESAEAQQQDKIENQLAIAEVVETLQTQGVL